MNTKNYVTKHFNDEEIKEIIKDELEFVKPKTEEHKLKIVNSIIVANYCIRKMLNKKLVIEIEDDGLDDIYTVYNKKGEVIYSYRYYLCTPEEIIIDIYQNIRKRI